MLNDMMRVYLTRAAQERAERRSGWTGKPMNDYQLAIVMRASFASESDGFDRRTIWRALELATAPELLPNPR